MGRAKFSSIKAKNAGRFQRTDLFFKVMTILESHHFRLPVCRFVIDLFDKKVMRQIVLEEEESEQDSSDESEDGSEDNESGEEEEMENENLAASPISANGARGYARNRGRNLSDPKGS